MSSTADAGRTALKRSEVLSFDDGLLTVRIEGHGTADGWATLAFHERQVEVDADGFHTVEIPQSELLAIRDFLNRITAAPDLLKALEAARQEIVLALAFLGRDGGTPRLDETAASLCKRLAAADTVAIATLAASKGGRIVKGEDITAMAKRLISEGNTDEKIMIALSRRFPRSHFTMQYIQRIRAIAAKGSGR